MWTNGTIMPGIVIISELLVIFKQGTAKMNLYISFHMHGHIEKLRSYMSHACMYMYDHIIFFLTDA
jgi:hypothetical protein